MENEKKEILKNNKLALSIVFVIAIAILLVGVSYAYFSANSTTNTQTITTDNITISFTNGTILRAENIMPMQSSDVLTKATMFPFSITNNGNHTESLRYELELISMDDELKNSDFKWDLYEGDTKVANGNFSTINNNVVSVLNNVEYQAHATKEYKIYVYILDSGAPQNSMQGKSMSAKVVAKLGLAAPTGYILSDGNDGIAINDTTLSCKNTINSDCYSGTEKNIVIPNNITVITLDTFANADLESVVFNNNLAIIGPASFVSNKLQTVVIPDSVTSIQIFAFKHNEIEDLVLSNNLETIGIGAFYDNKLKNVTIPSSVTTISNEAFSKNPTLVSIKNETNISFNWAEILASSQDDQSISCTDSNGNSATSFITGSCIVGAYDDDPSYTVTITE